MLVDPPLQQPPQRKLGDTNTTPPFGFQLPGTNPNGNQPMPHTVALGTVMGTNKSKLRD
jgi:hypothetical protein